MGPSVTASHIVLWTNDFLSDVMMPHFRSHAQAISYRDGVLKIAAYSGPTVHYLKGFDEELKHRFMEKFHDTDLKQVFYLIQRPSRDAL